MEENVMNVMEAPPAAKGVYFVSGIGTGVGKTVATGAMARYLVSSGRDAITVKMVQTGNDCGSEDLAAHRRMMGGVSFPEDAAGLTAPEIFSFPSSPALAASLEGKTVDLAKIARAVAKCAAAHEVTLVEGAGGMDVPLTDDVLAADFAAAQGWPLILVTCGSLGAINHALLSLDAAKMRNLPLAGVVHNSFFSDDPRLDEDAVAAVSRHLRRIGSHANIVRMPRIDPDGERPVDFGRIFG